MDLLLEFLTLFVYIFSWVFIIILWALFAWCLFIGFIHPVGGKILYALRQSVRAPERRPDGPPPCIVVEDSPGDAVVAEDGPGDGPTIEVAPLQSSGDQGQAS